VGALVDIGMALPSKAFDIWRRLYNRFDIEVGVVEGSAPEVGTSIIPVTQVDELLKQSRGLVSPTVDLSGGGSLPITMFQVPVGERWKVYRIFRTSTVAGSRVRFIDPLNGNVVVSLAGTAEEIITMGEGYILEENWIIAMQETGNGGDTSESLNILISAEEAF